MMYYKFLLIVLLFVTGCSTPVQMTFLDRNKLSELPDKGKSLIIFYRPEHFFASQMQSSIHEIRDDEPVLIGLISAEQMLAFQINPGRHFFMVIGERNIDETPTLKSI
jgi:thioredoxin-related protein